ncbi:MAG: hypothetical protein K1X28_10335 [Parachlamydiales bacterium]|nr:hypothetical protein [Parachlamydiales bacterium]
MKRREIREKGLVGTLFSKGNPKASVIVLGGSSGGLSESRAEKLAEEGFHALALAYFGCESLPPRLNQIPLEYFEKAIELLSGISDQIGLWGVSRGAELSLILGSLFPDRIHAIAALVPSSAVYGAFDAPQLPAWLYQGKPVAPNAPFSFLSSETGECEKSAICATPSFLHGMNDLEAFESSAIAVEKLKCPLLLISAEDDQMWPSAVFAGQIVDRLKKHKSPIDVSHFAYPSVGHAPSKGYAGLHPVLKRWFAYGGSPEENAAAAVEWVEKSIFFFKQHFGR